MKHLKLFTVVLALNTLRRKFIKSTQRTKQNIKKALLEHWLEGDWLNSAEWEKKASNGLNNLTSEIFGK